MSVPARVSSGKYPPAFPRHGLPDAPDAAELLRQDPSRLAAVAHEMARFSTDLRAICQAAIDLADGVGIEEAVADQVVGHAIREIRAGRRRVG